MTAVLAPVSGVGPVGVLSLPTGKDLAKFGDRATVREGPHVRKAAAKHAEKSSKKRS